MTPIAACNAPCFEMFNAKQSIVSTQNPHLSVHVILVELQHAKHAFEAPLVRKIGNPSSPEDLVMTSLYKRPSSVQTLEEGEGHLNVTCDCGCSR